MSSAKPVRDLAASPRIFENDLLDKLSRVDPRLPVIAYGPVVAILAGVSLHQGVGPLALAACLAIGYCIWTLTEYLGHRFLFHTEFPGRIGARIHFLLHGVHHEYPSDPLRLVMPLLMSVPIMAIAWLVLSLAAPAAYVLPLLAGFIAGYIVYDGVHYLVHHSRSQHPLFLKVKRLHMLHHFHDHAKGYGVSAPWLDMVFRTHFRR